MGGIRSFRQIESLTTTVEVNLLDAPSQRAKVLLVIPAGAKVLSTQQPDNGFRKVIYNGVTGWVDNACLKG